MGECNLNVILNGRESEDSKAKQTRFVWTIDRFRCLRRHNGAMRYHGERTGSGHRPALD